MKSERVPADNSAENYRDFVAECYHKLGEERDTAVVDLSLAEVKLRLFLALLDKPHSPERDAKAA